MLPLISIIEACIFYMIYFAKTIILMAHGIKPITLGSKTKPSKVRIIENLLNVLTLTNGMLMFSPLLRYTRLSIENYVLKFPKGLDFIGAGTSLLGCIFFSASVLTMKDSWRAGIPDSVTETKLITTGIYRYSRNPAFLGFYLLYLGSFLMYPLPHFFVTSILSMILFHIQIIQEEDFLTKAFDDYSDYMKKVPRYIGLKFYD